MNNGRVANICRDIYTSAVEDPLSSSTRTQLQTGDTPVLSADKIHVLSNENVDADFRVLSAKYYVDAKTQTLEATLKLGHGQPLLADYLYVLRSKTDSLSRYKIGRLV